VAVPILLSFVGLVMVGVGSFGCEMIKVSASGYYSYYSTIGFTSSKVGGACVSYGTTDVDAALQAGYAFAILATVVGVLTVIAAILTTFIRLPPVALLGMSGSAFVVAAFAVIVTGVGFAASGCNSGGISCTPGSQMYVVMVGVFFWIGAGTALLFVKKYARADIGERSASVSKVPVASISAEPVKEDEPTSSTVIETFINPDGTKTRTTTVTSFKDGAKIVEKTNETL
jgi:hypothetical protein